MTESSGTESDHSITFLRKGEIQQRMMCSGSVATNIENTFVTVEQLLDAIESDEPLTLVSGIGPKTAEVITDWYENRFEREEAASGSTIKQTSNTSLNISFHPSWDDAIGDDGDE